MHNILYLSMIVSMVVMPKYGDETHLWFKSEVIKGTPLLDCHEHFPDWGFPSTYIYINTQAYTVTRLMYTGRRMLKLITCAPKDSLNGHCQILLSRHTQKSCNLYCTFFVFVFQ